MLATNRNSINQDSTNHRVLQSMLVAVLLCGVFTGCQGETTSELTGFVKFAGKPVFPAMVVMRDDQGKGMTANLDKDGAFRATGVQKGRVYSVAIEPINIAGVGKTPPPLAEGEEPARREDVIPDKFKSANISFPAKYKSFDSSGLSIDCTAAVPLEPVTFDLK